MSINRFQSANVVVEEVLVRVSSPEEETPKGMMSLRFWSQTLNRTREYKNLPFSLCVNKLFFNVFLLHHGILKIKI